MSSDPQRFARLVLAAFDAAGRTTDELVHAAGGPSSTYMTGLRKAEKGADLKEPRSDTYRRIEAAAGWPTGSARKVWSGGDAPLPEAVKRIVVQDVFSGPSERTVEGSARSAGLASMVAAYATPAHTLGDDELLQRVIDVKDHLDELRSVRGFLLERYYDATTELGNRSDDPGWWDRPELRALKDERNRLMHGFDRRGYEADGLLREAQSAARATAEMRRQAAADARRQQLREIDEDARADIAADEQAHSIESEQEETERST